LIPDREMNELSETFKKPERLTSKKAITFLFENGKSFFCHPFQIIWSFSETQLPSPAQVAISVSKKNFKSAVERNLIKRRIREAYRKQKHILYDYLKSANVNITFIIIYKDKQIAEYPVIYEAINKMIKMLISSAKKSLQ